MATIPVKYIPTEYSIELNRSREFWEDERNANPSMLGYREGDI